MNIKLLNSSKTINFKELVKFTYNYIKNINFKKNTKNVVVSNQVQIPKLKLMSNTTFKNYLNVPFPLNITFAPAASLISCR